MIEKFRYTAEIWQRSTGEGETARMERRQLERERDRALGEKRVMERERDREREEKRVMERERDREREEKRVMERERDREREEKRVMERERERVRVELQRCQARANQLQERLEEVERREHEKVVVQEQAIAAEQRGPSWEVMEDELEETEEELGCGGWAKVKVAKLKVAAKCLHGQLIYDYHRQLFRREMDVAARVSHPNLLRFLGARLEGGMAILTEFMPTSLRALVNRRPRQRLPLEHVLSIAIDVARALNYLHNMSPDPIIHRDLSSANVLLQPSPDGGWLAKVSDYGTANFQSQLQTVNPGSPVYTAPESHDPALQTPKMDIYSFGVLLVEMYTCDFPAPERRAELMESIDHPRLLNLIRQCLNVDRDRRPTAAQLVDLLHAMQ
ncbi:Probable serine/threonine-protein kinase DDB_G0271682 [Geodia barretti]|uniref:Probable serine/threonine-protein kinase DDB_G0271682 n=1 Tax=Geodia barretti TaxID=519541 RepID=A0AA35X7A6_GEOBA|nr:Probable serine/threonine-protein kinase DDB_G0271682 [Geodia barretti]